MNRSTTPTLLNQVRLRALGVWAIPLLLFVGCSAAARPGQGLLTRLNNRGPVPLSADNPYIAANLLLAKEMEASAELRGFIKHRGPPAAIEISQDLFAPLRMNLYYPGSRDFYTTEDVAGAWVISGPFGMERDTLQRVSHMGPGGRAALLPSKSEIDRGEKVAAVNQEEEEESAIGKVALGSVPTEPFSSPAPQPPIPKLGGEPLPSDERSEIQFLATRIAEFTAENRLGNAELTPRGDVVHYITDPRENMATVARWYTFDQTNASRIARINNLSPSSRLSVGDTIVIPSYLIRNKVRLGKEALNWLLTATAGL